MYGHINDNDSFKLSKDFKIHKIDYTYKVSKKDDYYLNEHTINLTANNLLKETTYSILILNSYDHLKEKYWNQIDDFVYLTDTIINIEYSLDGKLHKETIDKYRLKGYLELKINLTFPKRCKNLKVNIKSNVKKVKKITNFYECIYIETK